jgi:hypothetical protein
MTKIRKLNKLMVLKLAWDPKVSGSKNPSDVAARQSRFYALHCQSGGFRRD